MTQPQASPKVLAVIPARGGSKGVPRKNIRMVCGKPLIAYTIETALAAKHLFHRIIVSTEDEEIAAIAQRYGAEVPFSRPAELAGDKVPTVPVLKHAVGFVEKQDHVRSRLGLSSPTDGTFSDGPRPGEWCRIRLGGRLRLGHQRDPSFRRAPYPHEAHRK